MEHLTAAVTPPAPPAAPTPQAKAEAILQRLIAQYKVAPNMPHIPMVFPAGSTAMKKDGSGALTGVDLTFTPATDADVEIIAKVPSITELRLVSTNVTDKGLAPLKNLPNLRSLSLYGTAVSDAGIEDRKQLKSLTFLGISTTKVTPAGMKALAEAMPGCKIQ